MYTVRQDVFNVGYPLLDEFAAHLLDIEGHGKEGKVHRDLVIPEVAETPVCHVILCLSEDSLRLDAALSSPPDTFLGSEPFPCLSLVFSQPVVDLYDSSVCLCLVTQAAEWASLAVLRSIACAFGAIPAAGRSPGRSDAFHVLAPWDRRNSLPPCCNTSCPDGTDQACGGDAVLYGIGCT